MLKMSKKSANAVIDRMQDALRLSSDSQLCRELKISRSTLGTWRQRDSVPYALCVNIAEEKNISLDWLLTGVGSMLKTKMELNNGTNFDDEDVRILNMIKRLPEPQKNKEVADIEAFLRSFDEAISHWVANNQNSQAKRQAA
jgi:hypothetical protein